MKKLLIIGAVLLMAGPALAIYDGSNSNYLAPYALDANTIALMHLDEQPGSALFAIEDNIDTPILAGLSVGNTNGWTGDPYNLDPNKTWVASQAGFGNCAYAWAGDSVTGNAGSMKAFDNGYYSASLHNQDATFEWWMNPDQLGGGWGARILKHQTGGDYGITIAGQALTFGWYKGGWLGHTFDTLMTIGSWSHVAIQVDNESLYDPDPALSASILHLFVNGVLQEMWTTAPGQAAGNWNTGPVQLFNDASSPLYPPRQFFGKLDEVRISSVLRYQVPEPSMMLLALGALAIFRKKQ